MSKRQGAVATSTYSTEFCAMYLATEEAITIHYMLRSLGIPVTEPTKMFGDNLGVIQNASMPEATMQKKHTAISFHRVRECVAAGVIAPYQIDGKDNFADIFTKPVDGDYFQVPCLGPIVEDTNKSIENVSKASLRGVSTVKVI